MVGKPAEAVLLLRSHPKNPVLLSSQFGFERRPRSRESAAEAPQCAEPFDSKRPERNRSVHRQDLRRAAALGLGKRTKSWRSAACPGDQGSRAEPPRERPFGAPPAVGIECELGAQ